MAVYNTSFMDNATNILDLAIGLGGSMGHTYLFGQLILASFFLIFLILGARQDFLQVLVVNLFISTIIAMLLFAAGLLQLMFIGICAVLFFIVLIFYLMS